MSWRGLRGDIAELFDSLDGKDDRDFQWAAVLAVNADRAKRWRETQQKLDRENFRAAEKKRKDTWVAENQERDRAHKREWARRNREVQKARAA